MPNCCARGCGVSTMCANAAAPPSPALVAAARCIVLPLPAQRGDLVNAPLIKSPPQLVKLAQSIAPGTAVFAGMPAASLKALLKERQALLFDYSAGDDFARANALTTAEGMLALLIELTPRALRGANVALTGYGRVAKAAAALLCALGACVTVAARSRDARQQARDDGCAALDIAALGQIAPSLDALVNTVPAAVVTAGVIAALPRAAVVLDLAGAPGGTDFAAAQRRGISAQLCPGLPGRFAPQTAAQVIADAIEKIIEEEKL